MSLKRGLVWLVARNTNWGRQQLGQETDLEIAERRELQASKKDIMDVEDIANINDVLSFLHEAIARERKEDPVDIAWSITGLMGYPVVRELQKQYPELEELIEASADLEVTEKAGYAPVGELWHKIKDLTAELARQVNAKS